MLVNQLQGSLCWNLAPQFELFPSSICSMALPAERDGSGLGLHAATANSPHSPFFPVRDEISPLSGVGFGVPQLCSSHPTRALWVCARVGALCLWLYLCSSVTTKQKPGFHFGQNTHSHVNNKLSVGWRYAQCNFSCGCMLLNKVLVLMQFSACKILQEHGTQMKISSFTQNYSLLIFVLLGLSEILTCRNTIK